MLINIRIEYRIQIYMHQILKILIITACYWIAQSYPDRSLHLKMYSENPLPVLQKDPLPGNSLDPHSTECSRICATPVLSFGGVRNAILNTLFSSSFSISKLSLPRSFILLPRNISTGIIATHARYYNTFLIILHLSKKDSKATFAPHTFMQGKESLKSLLILIF